MDPAEVRFERQRRCPNLPPRPSASGPKVSEKGRSGLGLMNAEVKGVYNPQAGIEKITEVALFLAVSKKRKLGSDHPRVCQQSFYFPFEFSTRSISRRGGFTERSGQAASFDTCSASTEESAILRRNKTLSDQLRRKQELAGDPNIPESQM